jgi:hypothetical protein
MEALNNDGHFFSLSMFLGKQAGTSPLTLVILIFFEFVLVSLIIFWITILFTAKVSLVEEKIAALLIAGGYLLWSVLTAIYSFTCTGKFCGMAIILPIPETFLLFGMPDIGKMGDILMFGFLILINTGLIYFFSSVCTSNIVKLLAKHKHVI